MGLGLGLEFFFFVRSGYIPAAMREFFFKRLYDDPCQMRKERMYISGQTG